MTNHGNSKSLQKYHINIYGIGVMENLLENRGEVINLKGVIINKGESYYTDLKKLSLALNNEQNNYNWLITNCECYLEKKNMKNYLIKSIVG